MEGLEQFQKYLQSQVNEKTARKYMFLIKRFFKDFDVDSVENISVWLTNQSRWFAILHWLKFNNRIEDRKLLVKPRGKAVKNEGVYLNRDELVKIVNAIPDEGYRVVALIQYITGVRAGDVLRTQTDWIERISNIKGFGMKIKMITKGGFERVVFIPSDYSDYVWEYVAGVSKKYPFLRGNSDNLTTLVDNNYHYYLNILKRVVEKLGHKDFRTHDFRRNFIDDAYTQFKDLRIVKDVAGHRQLTWTLKYLKKKIDQDEMTDAIQKLRG